MTALEVSEIRAMMNDLEKAGGSTDRILELLTVFEERVKPTEKLLRVCISFRGFAYFQDWFIFVNKCFRKLNWVSQSTSTDRTRMERSPTR